MPRGVYPRDPAKHGKHWFRKGEDPRRHPLTPDERELGQENAIYSIMRRFGVSQWVAKKCLHRARVRTEEARFEADPFTK